MHIISIISKARARYSGLALALVHKRDLARLGALDDHLLRDIGLTRADIANRLRSSREPYAYLQVKSIGGSKNV